MSFKINHNTHSTMLCRSLQHQEKAGAHCKRDLVPNHKASCIETKGTTGTKAVLLALKKFQDLCSDNIAIIATGCLYKQERRYEVGPTLCDTMENHDLVLQKTGSSHGTTHFRLPKCGTPYTIQVRLDHSNRVV